MKKNEMPLVCIVVLSLIMVFNIYVSHKQQDAIVEHINAVVEHVDTITQRGNDVVERVNTITQRGVAFQQSQAIISDIIFEYTRPKFEQLRKNLDKTSKEVVDYVEKSITLGPTKRACVFENVDLKFPEHHQKHKKNWEQKERSEAYKKYNLDGNYIAPEVFYFHHGLRFASQKIKDYIKDKDVLDCGAFIGDSVLVLKDYTNKNIFCYEFYKPCIEKFRKIMKLNRITSGYKLIPMALGESEKNTNAKNESLIICIPANSSSDQSNNNFNMTTIDEEAKRRNFKVGFIKVDVEGHGVKIIKGAINTIKEQRPVLSLAVYHNKEELFETKPFLEKYLNDYIFEFHLQQFHEKDMNELILFCYPKELQ